jgi:hypothetical protein
MITRRDAQLATARVMREAAAVDEGGRLRRWFDNYAPTDPELMNFDGTLHETAWLLFPPAREHFTKLEMWAATLPIEQRWSQHIMTAWVHRQPLPSFNDRGLTALYDVAPGPTAAHVLRTIQLSIKPQRPPSAPAAPRTQHRCKGDKDDCALCARAIHSGDPKVIKAASMPHHKVLATAVIPALVASAAAHPDAPYLVPRVVMQSGVSRAEVRRTVESIMNEYLRP